MYITYTVTWWVNKAGDAKGLVRVTVTDIEGVVGAINGYQVTRGVAWRLAYTTLVNMCETVTSAIGALLKPGQMPGPPELAGFDLLSWRLSRRGQEGQLLNGPGHPGLHSLPNLEYSVTGLCSSPPAPRVTKRRSFGNACKICFSMAKRR